MSKKFIVFICLFMAGLKLCGQGYRPLPLDSAIIWNETYGEVDGLTNSYCNVEVRELATKNWTKS